MKAALWTPSEDHIKNANMTRFIEFVNRKVGKKFKTGHLLISSPRWGEDKGEGDFMYSTLTPTLSRQREREIY